MSGKIPDLLVEQLALGELPPEQAERIRAQLEEAGDPRLAGIEASNREILEDYPPERMGPAIRRRLERDRAPQRDGTTRWLWWGGLAATAAAAILLWWTTRAGPTPSTLDRGLDGEIIAVARPPEIQFKGDHALSIKRKRAGGGEPLQAGDLVRKGDRLQVSYRATGWTHGVIVSVDGAGEVSLHFPESDGASTQLRQGGSVTLGHSYELDGAPKFERFYFVVGLEPLDVGDVMARAQRGGLNPETQREVVALELLK